MPRKRLRLPDFAFFGTSLDGRHSRNPTFKLAVSALRFALDGASPGSYLLALDPVGTELRSAAGRAGTPSGSEYHDSMSAPGP